jgi:hypothetical protein
MALSDFRSECNLADLHRSDLDAAPSVPLRHWFNQAQGRRVRGLQINLYKSLLSLGTLGRIDVNASTLGNRVS